MGFNQAPALPYRNLGIVEDGDTASQAIEKDKYIIWKGQNYFAKTDILQGETFVVDTNLTAMPEGVINGIVDTLNASSTDTYGNSTFIKRGNIVTWTCGGGSSDSLTLTNGLSVVPAGFRPWIDVAIAYIAVVDGQWVRGGMILRTNGTVDGILNPGTFQTRFTVTYQT